MRSPSSAQLLPYLDVQQTAVAQHGENEIKKGNTTLCGR